MKFKDLLRRKGFWVAVAALITIITQLCGVKIPAPYVNEIIGGICSVLVVTGLMSAREKAAADDALNNAADVETGEEKKEKESGVKETDGAEKAD